MNDHVIKYFYYKIPVAKQLKNMFAGSQNASSVASPQVYYQDKKLCHKMCIIITMYNLISYFNFQLT